eukprot:13747262-Alexandrium_andersonii.AAC.1
MKPLRVSFCESKVVQLLSPEAVHGVALAFLAKGDDSTPLRIYGPLGIRLADLCQSICPPGCAYVLDDMVSHFSDSPEFRLNYLRDEDPLGGESY